MPESPNVDAGSTQLAGPASSAQRLVDLTQHEIEALKTRYNLADAHTHQRQSEAQP